MEKSLSKKIWLLNGVLFLLVVLFVLFKISTTIYDDYFATYDQGGVIVGERKVEAKQEGVALQTIKYSKPRKLLNSGYRLITVSQTDYEIPKNVLEAAAEANDYRYGVTINAILFKEGSDDYRLLLDKIACIKRLIAPTSRIDSLQTYILYDIAFEDTNADGKINERDSGQLYISDVSGENFRKILPDSLKLVNFNETPDRDRVEISSLRIPADGSIPEEHWEQVTCYYDVEKHELKIDRKLNKLLEKARKILVD